MNLNPNTETLLICKGTVRDLCRDASIALFLVNLDESPRFSPVPIPGLAIGVQLRSDRNLFRCNSWILELLCPAFLSSFPFQHQAIDLPLGQGKPLS